MLMLLLLLLHEGGGGGEREEGKEGVDKLPHSFSTLTHSHPHSLTPSQTLQGDKVWL